MGRKNINKDFFLMEYILCPYIMFSPYTEKRRQFSEAIMLAFVCDSQDVRKAVSKGDLSRVFSIVPL